MRVFLILVAAAGVVHLSGAVGDRQCVIRHKLDLAMHWANPATDCSTYFRCNAKNELTEEACPSRRIYDSVTGKCVRPKSGICKTTDMRANTECDGVENGMVPVPGYCSNFYVCDAVLGPTLQECPMGSRFIQTGNEDVCVPDPNHECWQNECISQPNGNLPDSKSCATYYTCTNQKTERKVCLPGTYYSSTTESCQPDTDGSKCWENLCLGKDDNLLLPNPTDCYSYYKCQQNAAIPETCPTNTHFDGEQQKCVRGSCTDETTEGPSTIDTTTYSTPLDDTTTCSTPLDDTTTCSTPIDDTTTVAPACDCETGKMEANPDDCTLYKICEDGHWIDADCGSGNYFDVEENICQSGTGKKGETTKRTKREVNDTDALPINSELSEMCRNGKVSGLRMRYDQDCHAFLYCLGGELSLQKCPAGEYFNLYGRSCTPDVAGVCTDSNVERATFDIDYTQMCDDGTYYGERIPYKKDCTKFQYCLNGELFIQECPEGQYFDLAAYTCKVDVNGNCNNNSNNLLLAPQSVSGKIQRCSDGSRDGDRKRLASDCQKFLFCSRGVLSVHSCAEGEYFNYDFKRCTIDVNNECIQPDSQRTPSNVDFTRGRACTDGSLDGERKSIESDCHKFQFCSRGILTVHRCMDGEYFNNDTKRCKIDVNGQCNDVSVAVDELETESDLHVEYTRMCPDGSFFGERTEYKQDCHKFQYCINGELSIRDCPTGEYFDIDAYSCIGDEHKRCTESGVLLPNIKKSFIRLNETKAIQTSGVECPGGLHNGERIGNKLDCRSFFYCFNGELTMLQCSEGDYFDNVSKTCLIDRTNVCLNSAINNSEKTCRGRYAENEFVAHKQDCRKYYVCSNATMHEFDCGIGNYYDAANHVCMQDTLTTCFSNRPATCRGLYREGEKVKHPFSCRLFNICTEGKLIEQTCGVGKFYDAFEHECAIDLSNECIAQFSKESNSEEMVPSCLGLYRNGEMSSMPNGDCRRYQLCDNGMLRTFDCGLGMYFNGILGLCEMDIDAKCKSNRPVCMDLYYEDQKIVHPTECRKFQICHDGVLVLQDCGFGRYFNEEELSCTIDTNNICAESERDRVETKIPSCLGIYVENEFVAHPSDCRKYHVCSSGQLILKDCGALNYFDSLANECRPDENEVCIKNRPSCLNMYYESQKVQHEDCRKFDICYMGRMLTQDCGIGKYFNVDSLNCDDDIQNVCQAPDISASKLKTCMGLYNEGQLVPHPNDCRKYQKCIDKQLEEHNCGQGNYFDGTLGTCEPDTNEVCEFNRPTCLGLYYEGQLVAHPANCRQFQICFKSQMKVQDCGIGKYFNNDELTCLEDIDQICQQVNPINFAVENSCMGLYYEGQIVPHPTECQHFQVCHGGRLYIQDCGNDMFFDSLTNACKLDTQNLCHRTELSRATLFGLDGNFTKVGTCMGQYPEGELMSIPHECRDYNICLKDNLYRKSCGNGNYFDPIRLTCDVDLDHTCPMRKTKKLRKQNKLLGIGRCYDLYDVGQFVLHPRDCSRFFICDIDGDLKMRYCGLGNYFDTKMNICRKDVKRMCQSRKITVPELWEHKAQTLLSRAVVTTTCSCAHMGTNQTVPHESECAQFYQCTEDGELQTFSCPTCYKFDYDNCTNTGSCVLDTCQSCWPSTNNCTAGGGDDDDIIDPTICTNQTNGVLLPNPDKCNAYYICVDEIGIEELCPEGEWFSNSTNMCEVDIDAVCINPCSSVNASTIYLPSMDCSQFYDCNDGNATVENCSSGQGFDISLGICSNEYTCYSDMCVDQPDGTTYPAYWNPKEFFVCIDGVQYLKTCVDGTTFNAQYGICATAPSINCNQTVCTSSCYDDEPFASLSGNTSFCLCTDSQAYEKFCPAKSYFTPSLGICVSVADCDATLCVDAADGTTSPNRNDIYSYCLCMGGLPQVVTCPNGEIYNDMLGICRDASLSSAMAEEKFCPYEICFDLEFGANFPILGDPTGYCTCGAYGNAIYRPCANGTSFDNEIGDCVSSVSGDSS